MQRLKQRLKHRSAKTTNNVLTVLSMMLKKALEWGVTLKMTERYMHVSPEVLDATVRLLDHRQIRGEIVEKAETEMLENQKGL